MTKIITVLTRLARWKIPNQSLQLPGWRSARTKNKAYVIGTGILTGISLWSITWYTPVLSESVEEMPVVTGSIMDKVLSSLADPNNRTALRDKPTTSLILSLAVYKSCSVKWLIDSAPSILSYASYMHLTKPLNFIIRHTVFDQFVGGESSEDCQRTMSKLKDQGIGVILALSVESDIGDVDGTDTSQLSMKMNQQADYFMNTTKQCVLAASTQPGSFIALKISALTSPLLLQKVTGVLSDLYESFNKHASISSQTLSQYQVCHVVAQHRGLVNVEENVREIVHNSNEIDIVDFKQMMLLHRPSVMNLLSNVLSEQDRKNWLQMLHRVDEICSLAKSCGVKVLIDAEQSYLQLAIDQAASVMEQKHNQLGSCPTVFNTCTFLK
jgi:proline dehydrogenase